MFFSRISPLKLILGLFAAGVSVSFAADDALPVVDRLLENGVVIHQFYHNPDSAEPSETFPPVLHHVCGSWVKCERADVSSSSSSSSSSAPRTSTKLLPKHWSAGHCGRPGGGFAIDIVDDSKFSVVHLFAQKDLFTKRVDRAATTGTQQRSCDSLWGRL